MTTNPTSSGYFPLQHHIYPPHHSFISPRIRCDHYPFMIHAKLHHKDTPLTGILVIVRLSTQVYAWNVTFFGYKYHSCTGNTGRYRYTMSIICHEETLLLLNSQPQGNLPPQIHLLLFIVFPCHSVWYSACFPYHTTWHFSRTNTTFACHQVGIPKYASL